MIVQCFVVVDGDVGMCFHLLKQWVFMYVMPVKLRWMIEHLHAKDFEILDNAYFIMQHSGLIFFTKFKQSFGGAPVEYAGTYDIVLKPIKYHFYQLTRRLNRFIRRH